MFLDQIVLGKIHDVIFKKCMFTVVIDYTTIYIMYLLIFKKCEWSVASIIFDRIHHLMACSWLLIKIANYNIYIFWVKVVLCAAIASLFNWLKFPHYWLVGFDLLLIGTVWRPHLKCREGTTKFPSHFVMKLIKLNI